MEEIRGLKRQSEAGDANAMQKLALAYFQGDGVEKDIEQGLTWQINAAEHGNAEAQSQCAELCRNVEEPDFKAAFDWEKKAAEQGYPLSQYNLGHHYDKGMGTSQDKEQAYHWFKKAAENGFSDAKYSLAVAYLTGQGTSQDMSQGIYWLEQASNDGHAGSKTRLGAAYIEGMGVSTDEEKGISLLREAASLGDEKAENLLNEISSGSSSGKNSSYSSGSSTSKEISYEEEISKLKKQLLVFYVLAIIGFVIGFAQGLSVNFGFGIFTGLMGLLIGLGLPSLWRIFKWTREKVKSIVAIFTNEENAGFYAGFLTIFFGWIYIGIACPIVSIQKYFTIRKKLKYHTPKGGGLRMRTKSPIEAKSLLKARL